MADLTITAASVLAGSNAKTEEGVAAVALTAGQSVSINSSGNVALFDNNAVAPANSLKGVALNGAAAGQPVRVQTDGDVTIGAALTKGAAYYGSDTAGGICLFADLASGEGVSLLGVAKSTTEISMAIRNTGAVI
jgi:hypothetical protein